ncbi:hypothetical protein PQR17_06435 [Paraburkholderia sediminicola]
MSMRPRCGARRPERAALTAQRGKESPLLLKTLRRSNAFKAATAIKIVRSLRQFPVSVIRGHSSFSVPRRDVSPDVRSDSDLTMKLHRSNSSLKVRMSIEDMLFRESLND